MNNDSVSVIIPVYNNVLYLAEAVESVLKQSYTNCATHHPTGSHVLHGNLMNKNEHL